MALLRRTVLIIIGIVADDKDSYERIESIFSILGKHAGFTRNALMATALGFMKTYNEVLTGKAVIDPINKKVHEALGKTALSPPAGTVYPFDPNRPGSMGYEYQCTEIATVAANAIQKELYIIPEVKRVGVAARSVGFAHAGVELTMADKTAYVIDWWATLDLSNPLIFRAADFDQNRKEKAVKFQAFTGL